MIVERGMRRDGVDAMAQHRDSNNNNFSINFVTATNTGLKEAFNPSLSSTKTMMVSAQSR
jgi:hypothetical protein